MRQLFTIPDKMHVLNLHAVGELVYEEREVPAPQAGEVLLQIKACGICSSDIERIFVNGTYHFPTVPGHEFSGQVVALGDGVPDEMLGRRASVFPLLPCRSCHSCSTEDYPLCSNYNYFGSRCDGGYSEYLAVPVWNLVFLDDDLDYCVAALAEPSAVSLHAVHIGQVKKGDKVAVIGTGTIGILIAAFCRLQGADVYICGRRKESMDFVESLGFPTIPVSELKERSRKCTDGVGMDVVFEAVGTNQAMESAITGARNSGVIVAVGNPKADFQLERNIYWQILRRQLTLKGTWNSDYKTEENDWREVVSLMQRGGFPFAKLITRTYALSDADAAFGFLRDKSVSKAKVMFVME